MNKKPRFFCDNCGHEVGRDAKSCAHCGRFFASVRCPSCGYIGGEKTFANGCPSCGYSAPPAARAGEPADTQPPRSARPLPLWVYLITVAAFITVCIVVFFKLLR